jgi:hypothetical protein
LFNAAARLLMANFVARQDAPRNLDIRALANYSQYGCRSANLDIIGMRADA